MEKSFEFFSLDEHLKEKLRKGPEYQVGHLFFVISPLNYQYFKNVNGLEPNFLQSRIKMHLHRYALTLTDKTQIYIFRVGWPREGRYLTRMRRGRLQSWRFVETQ